MSEKTAPLRRCRAACAVAAMVLLVVLLQPGVRSRLCGALLGEPTWKGRPASWWRSCIAGLRVEASDRGVLAMGGGSERRIFAGYYERSSVVRDVLEWFDRLLGRNPARGREEIIAAS